MARHDNTADGGMEMSKLDGKYRGLTEEEREAERRVMDAWDERRERGPGYAAPLCGGAAENDAFKA